MVDLVVWLGRAMEVEEVLDEPALLKRAKRVSLSCYSRNDIGQRGNHIEDQDSAHTLERICTYRSILTVARSKLGHAIFAFRQVCMQPQQRLQHMPRALVGSHDQILGPLERRPSH